MRKIGGLVFKIKDRIKFKRKSNPFIFKRVKKKKSFQKRNILFGNISRKLLPTFGIALASISVLFLFYLLYQSIINLRRDDDSDLKIETVYGFDIPSYPQSEFIFRDKLNDETVKNFISLGNSVYRLPRDADIKMVFEYYKTELPKLGWSSAASVPLSSEEKLYGEYWIKGEKGLRIYSRLNDVWYQTTTVLQAQNGLEDIVKKETARKLLLLTTEKTELLPDYPWRLSYPTEYSSKYYGSSVSSLQGVKFQKLGSDNIVYLEPIGFNGSVTFDQYIDRYLESYNKKNKTKWQVVNSYVANFNGQDSIKASITNGKDNASVYAFNNIGNSVVYILSSFEDNDPFFNYIYKSIKPSSTPESNL